MNIFLSFLPYEPNDLEVYNHILTTFNIKFLFRNFMSVDVIKQVISGMSYDKLNVFHWHITGKV